MAPCNRNALCTVRSCFAEHTTIQRSILSAPRGFSLSCTRIILSRHAFHFPSVFGRHVLLCCGCVCLDRLVGFETSRATLYRIAVFAGSNSCRCAIEIMGCKHTLCLQSHMVPVILHEAGVGRSILWAVWGEPPHNLCSTGNGRSFRHFRYLRQQCSCFTLKVHKRSVEMDGE